MSARLIALVAVGLLTGCEARLNVNSQPGQVSTVKVPTQNGVSINVDISEMCYDGTVYLVTPKGGISPKVKAREGGSTMGFSSSPFMECK